MIDPENYYRQRIIKGVGTFNGLLSAALAHGIHVKSFFHPDGHMRLCEIATETKVLYTINKGKEGDAMIEEEGKILLVRSLCKKINELNEILTECKDCGIDVTYGKTATGLLRLLKASSTSTTEYYNVTRGD